MLYGVPGDIGGAATKLRDLISILKSIGCIITIVAPDSNWARSHHLKEISRSHGLRIECISNVSLTLGHVVLAVCERGFFISGAAERFKRMNIRVVWSNDMMWTFDHEIESAKNKIIDRVIFVSEIQRKAFENIYSHVDYRIVPNYVAPERFPFVERRNPVFTIGRLSRPDPVKYPIDFPVFYEEFGLEEVRFRVQAWNDDLRRKYGWHRFGPEWELFAANKIPAADFLCSLDLFVYPLGHRVVESWGRSTVEAMLTGCVAVVPRGHNFENMIVDGESGFICDGHREFKKVVRELYSDHNLFRMVSLNAAQHARKSLCNFEIHQGLWRDALTF